MRQSGGVLMSIPRPPEPVPAGCTGPLEVLLAQPGVTDVLVNAPDEVWVDRGSGLERVAITFADDEAVRALAVRLVTLAGRRLDDASPYADAVLRNGTRVHAVLSPIAVGGTALSLRIPRAVAFSLVELVAAGTLTADALPWLDAIVTARLSLLLSGASGSGKTTVLASLLGRVGRAERLILVEDTPELAPRHPHVVRLTARPPNIEGAGAVTLRELVRQALRMRPDRLVVGEARGAEVMDLLAAFNTGHAGGAATVHANAAGEVPARLEALAATAGISRAALHSQLAAAVQAVLHLRRDPDGTRRLHEICVPVVGPGGVVRLPVALRRGVDGLVRGPAWTALVRLLVQRGVTPPATP
jgi:pilus assembly protein CpaF